MNRSVAFIVVVALLPIAAVAEAQNAEAEIRKAQAARTAARTARNVDEWSRGTMDSYFVIDAQGERRSKTAQLAQFKSGQPGTQTTASRKEESLNVYGNTALLVELVQDANGPRRETVVWVRDGGAWKVAAVQMTPIRKQ